MDIVDVQSIWVCGPSTFHSSKDGGHTWESLPTPVSEGCRLVNFLDDENGWASSLSKLVATKDGGNSWEEISLPEEIRKITAISLLTPSEGYLLDIDRTLYSTEDGGQNWSRKTLAIEDSDLELMSWNYASAAVRFTDHEHGLVIMNLAGGGKSQLLALHTADSGETWERYTVPAELGVPYLSHDGEYLTVTKLGGGTEVTLLKHQTSVENGG